MLVFEFVCMYLYIGNWHDIIAIQLIQRSTKAIRCRMFSLACSKIDLIQIAMCLYYTNLSESVHVRYLGSNGCIDCITMQNSSSQCYTIFLRFACLSLWIIQMHIKWIKLQSARYSCFWPRISTHLSYAHNAETPLDMLKCNILLHLSNKLCRIYRCNVVFCIHFLHEYIFTTK